MQRFLPTVWFVLVVALALVTLGIGYLLGNSYPVFGAISSGVDCVQFIEDETILDGSVLAQGVTEEKIWRVRNCGDTTWDNRVLRRRYGEGNQPSLKNSAPEFVPIPALKPEDEGKVGIPITAGQPGEYRIWFDIVKAEEVMPKEQRRDILWVFFQVR